MNSTKFQLKNTCLKTNLRSGKIFFGISRVIPFVLLLMSSVFAQAQISKKVDWKKLSSNKSATFYDVQKDFKQYWQGKTIKKGMGYKPFKRWEALMAPRVYPSGDMTLPNTIYENFIEWQKNKTLLRAQLGQTNTMLSTGNWTALGPFSRPTGFDAGMGRVDYLRFNPLRSETMYVGTPDGGLWRSYNGGTNWMTTNTDFLPVIGVADLAISADTATMYIATGSWEGDKASRGIYKSTDLGATWVATSLVFPLTAGQNIRKLEIDPSNSLIMIATTRTGVYRTTNGWNSFTQVIATGDYYDVKFKPGSPATVYVAGVVSGGSIVNISNDHGATWTATATGLPTSDVSRIILGVTPASGSSGIVYALLGNDAGGYKGLYRSTNSGTSFGLRSTQSTSPEKPNILNASITGDPSNPGGQATHDLAIAISPTNADIVTVGGISQFRSTNGGVDWEIFTFWYGDDPAYPGVGDPTAPYIHADVQSITYLPGSSTTIFTTCDGGISKTTNDGVSWTYLADDLVISQESSIGLSASDPTLFLSCLQDIGFLKSGTPKFDYIGGGDGEDAFIDRTNNNVFVTSDANGSLTLVTNGGATREGITGLPAGNLFFSPVSQDPTTPNIVYAGGRDKLYTSSTVLTNPTVTWTHLGSPVAIVTGATNPDNSISNFAVAPSNSQIIYALKYLRISKTTDRGATPWIDITGDLPVGSAEITNLTVSNTDPLKVWVTFSGFSAGNKVFKTTDGGTTWTNVSAGLPNIPFNTIVYTNNSAVDAVYVGGDIGVYYRDNTMSSWAPYMTGLPNTRVRDLEIFYPTGKLRAATYGRGAWETDLNTSVSNYTITASAGSNGSISPSGAVTVASGADKTFTITPNAGFVVDDVLVDGSSEGAITSYTFDNVTEDHTISATFKVSSGCTPPTLSASITHVKCHDRNTGAINLSTSGGTGPFTYAWRFPGPGTATTQDISGLLAGNYYVTVTGAGGCTATARYVVEEPTKLIITVTGKTNVSCNGGNNGSITVNAKGGTTPYTYKINTNSNYQSGRTFGNRTASTYSVTVKDKNGCTAVVSNIVISQPSVLKIILTQKKDVSCYNGSNGQIKVSASGGTSSYQFKLNNGSYRSNGTFSNLRAGTYNATVKDAKGCTKSLSVVIKNGTGNCIQDESAPVALGLPVTAINESILKAQISPNPSENEFKLILSGSSNSPVEIRVVDIDGRPVYKTRGSANQSYKFGQRFKPGMYIIEVNQGGKAKTLKVIKN